MSEHIEKLIAKVNKLEREVERLRMIEGVGVWADYTPTITYGGGTTDPTSASITVARYCRTGNAVYFAIRLTVTVGTGDRTSTQFSLPVKAANVGFGSGAREGVTGAVPQPAAAYFSNTTTLVVYHGAMANDGIIDISGIYEV